MRSRILTVENVLANPFSCLPFAGIPAIPMFGVSPCTRAMSKQVRILNPVSDCKFTSRNRAGRFVKKGRAVWIEPGVSIRFVEADRQHRAAQRAVDKTRCGYDRAAYSGMAQLRALVNLPMVAPAKFLGLGKRKGASRNTFLASQGLA